MGRAAADNRGVALLTIHQRNHADHTIQLHGEGYRIGRDAGMEICIEQASVSRLHALLQKSGRHWILRDQGSTNGLWWQGRRVQELELQTAIESALLPLTKRKPPGSAFRDPASDSTSASGVSSESASSAVWAAPDC